MTRYFIRSAIDWLFRKRSTGLYLIRAGATLLTALLVGLTIGVRVPTNRGPLIFNWSTSGGTADAISDGIFIIAAALIVLGLIMVHHDWRALSRRRALVIEVRGLRDWNGEPLAEAVPGYVPGRREQVLVDVRQGLIDGKLIEPDAAVRKIVSLPDDLARRAAGMDRGDLTYIIGGLAPVPLSFLVGVILDDEALMEFMDWDRHAQTWRPLDGEDDGRRFAIHGLEAVERGTGSVALAVSASYDVDVAAVTAMRPNSPLVTMKLEGKSTGSHWSEQKQQALGRQFLEVAMELGGLGVREILLFLAAPGSLVFRFGRLYDKRNLPALLVCQYEQGGRPPYPWAIAMPVAGRATPDVVGQSAISVQECPPV